MALWLPALIRITILSHSPRINNTVKYEYKKFAMEQFYNFKLNKCIWYDHIQF